MASGGENAHQRRGPADRGEYREAANLAYTQASKRLGQRRFDPLRLAKAIASLVLEWMFSFS
jgi:hypothetical protein